jgi:thiamine-phosphate diphosphorylase
MIPHLHLVTNDAVLAAPSFLDTAERVLAVCGTAAALHLRGHETSGAALHAVGERLAAACLRNGAWLLVNDRIDVAMAIRANGVQLGTMSMPIDDARALLGAGARIGYSAHGALEAVEAVADGADFVVLGTIYDSASHAGRVPAGIVQLRETAARAGAPVIAIGGITPERVAEVAGAGAAGAAVLGGVWAAPDPVTAAEKYMQAATAAWQSRRVTA